MDLFRFDSGLAATGETVPSGFVRVYVTDRLNDFQTEVKVESHDRSTAGIRRSPARSVGNPSPRVDTSRCHDPVSVTASRKITSIRYGDSSMFELLSSGTVLLALAALAAFAVAVIAIKIAIKIAIRVGIVAAVVLAALYATGFVGLPF